MTLFNEEPISQEESSAPCYDRDLTRTQESKDANGAATIFCKNVKLRGDSSLQRKVYYLTTVVHNDARLAQDYGLEIRWNSKNLTSNNVWIYPSTLVCSDFELHFTVYCRKWRQNCTRMFRQLHEKAQRRTWRETMSRNDNMHDYQQ